MKNKTTNLDSIDIFIGISNSKFYSIALDQFDRLEIQKEQNSISLSKNLKRLRKLTFALLSQATSNFERLKHTLKAFPEQLYVQVH